jgi:hypothetical protein
MKDLVLAIAVLACGLPAIAQNIQIRVGGRGLHVCGIEETMTKRIWLGRGVNDTEAAANAKNECIQHNENESQSIFCSNIISCDVDPNSANAKVDIGFVVSREGARISITSQSEGQGQMCVLTNSMTNLTFVAAVPTKTEAIASTRNQCLDANENESQSIFCSDVNQIHCEPATLVHTDLTSNPEQGIRELLEKIPQVQIPIPE